MSTKPKKLTLDSITEGVPRAAAGLVHKPQTRHAMIGKGFGSAVFDQTTRDLFTLAESMEVLEDTCKAVREGQLGIASDLLVSQAMSLDVIFTDMVSRAGNNLGEYPHAVDRYMRLAMKAQSQSRATIEALANMYRPREQTVRHVHVNDGGQAVIAETIHMGGANGKWDGQPHASSGDASIAALPGANPLGAGVPFGGDAERSLPDARREVAGRTPREPKRVAARS